MSKPTQEQGNQASPKPLAFLARAEHALAPAYQQRVPEGRKKRMLSSDTAVISESQLSKAGELKRQGSVLYQRRDYFDSLSLFQKAVGVFKLQDLTQRLKLTCPQAF